MKLIAKGSKKSPPEFEGRCRSCGATYRAMRNELKIEINLAERYEFARTDCPECGAKGDVVFYEVYE
jgi:ribosomal protein S27E